MLAKQPVKLHDNIIIHLYHIISLLGHGLPKFSRCSIIDNCVKTHIPLTSSITLAVIHLVKNYFLTINANYFCAHLVL